MIRWINVDENQRQITHVDDPTFRFGIFMDDYSQMDGHMLPLHWHRAIEYQFLVSGKVEMHFGNEITELKIGECIFINSNTLHGGIQLDASEDTIVCAITFHPEVLSGTTQTTVYQKYFQSIFGKAVHGFKIDCESATGKNIYDILVELSRLTKDNTKYELIAISQISQLWLNTLNYIEENNLDSDNLNETYSHTTSALQDMLRYIQENYHTDISIDDLAQYAHICRSECFRYFKNYTGKTPFEYINSYRLLQAEHLLRTTTRSIVDIGLSCGFTGQSYFGKVFKQQYGVSPAQYRKDHN